MVLLFPHNTIWERSPTHALAGHSSATAAMTVGVAIRDRIP